ncbi:MAG: hypothetical protein ACLFOY_13535, partial [Desulfatibacillaceae bacterium]
AGAEAGSGKGYGSAEGQWPEVRHGDSGREEGGWTVRMYRSPGWLWIVAAVVYLLIAAMTFTAIMGRNAGNVDVVNQAGLSLAWPWLIARRVVKGPEPPA